ncbi:MAG: cytochrome c oxidase subunit II [Desulfovibrionaceae bacterium]|nr:cytochrome c oxidase subunit II [Desulfovibrionaceae bacterium]MBF0513095.1 cytochrome c oxidase subunit II [Desulfovibrionaceae bacterium]
MNMKSKQRASIFVLLLAFGLCLAALSATAQEAKIIKITAQRFKYTPDEIALKKGEPVVLEFTSLDRLHGFSCPDFGIRADIAPGKTAKVSFTPDKTGRFLFHCDIFCGSGHEDMAGVFVVKE